MGSDKVDVPNQLNLTSRGVTRRIAYNQQQFDSSTSKNRELFLRTLTKRMVVDWNVPTKRLDTLRGTKND